MLWLGAVVVFGVLNAVYDSQLGLAVAITIALGGITTTAITYLLSERVLRAATARAMMSRPPKRPVVPGRRLAQRDRVGPRHRRAAGGD